MKILLDAGHGINTPGKRSPDGMKEFEFNSMVANYAKEYLLGYDNVEVLFSHSDTIDVPLQDRTDFGNREGVDLFISIHANAFGYGGWNETDGIETFVYVGKPEAAFNLAVHIQNELIRETGRPNRGVKASNFHVLRESKMTAVLVECGFMTNKVEATLLRNDVYRQKCAKAITNGIVKAYGLEPKPVRAGVYRVQIGAYKEYKNAMALVDKLKEYGIDAFITE